MTRLIAWILILPSTVGLLSPMAMAAPAGDAQEASGGSRDYVWLEGEAPAAMPDGMAEGGAARPAFLSGGKWLLFTADAKEVDTKVPAQGFTMRYPFNLAKGGRQHVWARIGFEFARAPFEWRIDAGEWNTVAPDALTTDLMELSFFCEVAWLKLTEADLAVGPHTLEVRLPRYTNAKGEKQRTLFALDAICISPGEFLPHGPYKPGEAWRTEQDERAARHVFELPEPRNPAERATVKLTGVWEVCRHDEQRPTEVAAPIADLPKHPFWTAIEVPGDKNERADLVFAHRIWYRTRVQVPVSYAGRSFHLVFPANSLNTTVYVNGVFCGFDKNPLARVQIDVTKGVKPGQVNEVWVGIKDIWYAREADPKDPLVLRRTFNTPLAFFGNGWQRLVYPVWNQKQSGILGTPELVCAGPVYAADVFAKPSVARKQLGIEVTLANPTVQPAAGELLCEAVNDRTGQVEMTGPVRTLSIPAGAEQTVEIAADWPSPKLWWPDDPNLYRLRTTVKLAGKPVDVKETSFGFREWSRDGIHLRLNGIKWQGFSEMSTGSSTPEDLIAIMKSKRNYGFVRMWPGHGGKINFLGKEPDEFLTMMDRAGVVIRRSGYLDGEAIGYLPAILKPLAPNWYDHLTAWIKGERNHPSVMLWSVENEINFINARNVGQLDVWEPIATKAWEIVEKVDPTRPMMIDGGGATRANTLPIQGDHYSTKPFWNYPQLAYEANAKSPCGTWTWDEQRPKFIGEELFAAGINPAYAYFGGECVFQGKVASRPAVGKAMQVISQGYRWFGIAGCDFCQSPTDADGSQYNGWSPRAVLVRQWDWTFGSGEKATRTFGIFNSTRFADPLTFTCTLVLDGKQVATQTTVHKIAPGENEKFDREIAFPEVTERKEGELVLTLSVADGAGAVLKEVFRDVKAISVLPRAKPQGLAGLGAGELFVYDPQGSAVAFLKANGLAYTSLDSLAPPPAAGKVWLIGKDALTAAESTTGAFSAYAATGGRVLILEQENALRYQGLNPAEIDAETNLGRVAFCEDLSHPLLRGLENKDFFTWEPGEVVYRNAYVKPRRGAKSLLQCNESLTHSALAVIPVGPGMVALSQAVVAEKAAANAAARMLLLNLLDFCRNYRLEHVPVTASVEPALAKVLDEANLQYAKAAGPLEALAKGRIAIVSATPANLKVLADNLAAVRGFTESGGRLVLHGLTPEGLAEYNKLVGFEHMIRPFRRERVMFAPVRHPLTAGLGLADVQLYSSKAIFSFQSGKYVASDTFSHVVDLEDVAPFATPASDFHYNLVNGMVSADGWPYICNEPADKSVYTFTLPKPQTIASWTWVGNTFYDRTSRVSLTVDNDEAGKLVFDVPEQSEPVTLEVKPPKTGTVFTIRHEKHTDLPDKKQNGKMILGCDNLSLLAQRPADFSHRVRPMLNVGGLVEYPQGRGGIILCNLLFKEAEEAPGNALKKRIVLTVLLQNLKAPFAGKTVIAGANLAYAPLDLSKHANQYRTEQGWFGDRKKTFKDLPTGNQTFAGVKFNVYEFATSPVPTAVMLGGRGVPGNLPEQVTGIPVGRKADALFFLHAARIDQPRSAAERKDNKRFEVAKYVIHYADGQSDEVPVCLEIDIDSYQQSGDVRPLPGAQVGWAGKFEGSDVHAVAYVKQWNNPRPDVPIQSLDLVYGKDRRGVPALLAVTAATAQ